MDILSTFCGVFMALQWVKSMLRIFELGSLLFDCFVNRRTVTCLKRFTRYWHYAGEVMDDKHRQTRRPQLSQIAVPKLERLVAV